MRRTLELSLSVAGLLLLAPLFLAIAVAIRLDSPGPVIYRQIRVGRHGRTFTILKFRTMRHGPGDERLLTVGGDSRVTRVGRVLRRWKLDELLQLVNVARGEMAFVGPRPEVPAYVALFHEQFKPILAVRPGITHRAALLFRHEEEMLARAVDPERYYRERIMPRKLQIYRQDLDRSTFADDLVLVLATLREVAVSKRGRSAARPEPQTPKPEGSRPEPLLPSCKEDIEQASMPAAEAIQN